MLEVFKGIESIILMCHLFSLLKKKKGDPSPYRFKMYDLKYFYIKRKKIINCKGLITTCV